MSPRARAAKTSASSPSKSKKKSVPIQKKIPVKKSSSTKTQLEQSSSIITQPRQKRLSSLTAATLLQYCTSILSPSRKGKSIPKKEVNKSTKRPISNVCENIPTRAHREASSRASAMIMQQTEIERSRYNYSIPAKHSTTTIRRHRKDDIPPEPFKFNIPPVPPLPVPAPSITNVSNQTEYAQSSNAVTIKSTQTLPATTIIPTNSKYPSLTEAILAEHDRSQETITTKHDNLLKWTKELASFGRLSPPYSEDEISPDSKTTDSLPVNLSSRSVENLSTATTPAFLFPSSAYPLDLRSFYPLLPCWQYPSWSLQSSTYSISSSSKTSLKHHRTSKKSPTFNSLTKQKKEALTFHLHTHHHHHIHNSNSKKPTTIPLSPENSSILNNNKETKTVNNVIKNEHQQISSTGEDEVLNLSTNFNGAIKKTTRRKSSPVKRRVDSGTKSNSPEKTSQIIANNSSGVDLRRVLKRRSVSAATTNSPTIVSITSRTLRGKRTISATNRNRSYSPASITLPLSNHNQRKKQKILHYWILFGKSEPQLVSIDADQPPVFRECYSSIRHTTEKDVIKSNDCVILRSDTETRQGATPYLAKVKWFWEEPTTGEIQMSLIWYYHPEHTELSLHVRKRFLPNELLASKYYDCVSVACIEDKCYVLTLNEYNRYCLREKSVNLFEHSEPVGQLKFLLNKNIPTVQHRSLPAKTVGNQNIFFCRYVYDYRVKRILKNPSFVTIQSSM